MSEVKAPDVSYWLTRASEAGVLLNRIDIWLLRPERVRLPDGDVHWLALDDQGESVHTGHWTVDEARKQVGWGVPDNDRECTRVGREVSL